MPRDTAGFPQLPSQLVRDVHAAGLVVHAFSFRNENRFLPAGARSSTDPNAYGDPVPEYQQFYALGADGLFSDFPDTAVTARGEYLAGLCAAA